MSNLWPRVAQPDNCTYHRRHDSPLDEALSLLQDDIEHVDDCLDTVENGHRDLAAMRQAARNARAWADRVDALVARIECGDFA